MTSITQSARGNGYAQPPMSRTTSESDSRSTMRWALAGSMAEVFHHAGPVTTHRMGRVSPAPPEIFKAYDVRGIYGQDLDGDTAEAIGRAFVRVLAELSGKAQDELRVGLGRDMRLSAPEMAGRYRDGMTAEGADVLDAGMVGTEMVYFLVGSRDLDGGLMCTASHNPKAYTGAELVERGGIALSGDRGVRALLRIVEA